MAAQVEKVALDGTVTNIGSAGTISGVGSPATDAILSSAGEAIDRTTYNYRVKILTGSAVANRVYGMTIGYDITDILKAALYNG